MYGASKNITSLAVPNQNRYIGEKNRCPEGGEMGNSEWGPVFRLAGTPFTRGTIDTYNAVQCTYWSKPYMYPAVGDARVFSSEWHHLGMAPSRFVSFRLLCFVSFRYIYNDPNRNPYLDSNIAVRND